MQQFDDFKKCYGEILYRWGLREKRAEVLKFVSCPPDPHKGIGLHLSESLSVISYHLLQKSRRWKSKREGSDSGNRSIKAAGKVIVQDIACLLPVHKSLGELYILNVNDIQETCQKNAASALLVGRRDLVQVWSLATVATDLCLGPKSDPDLETPWARHPFGRQLLESLLAHYSQLRDVQTLAMLCSVFEAQSRPQGIPNPFGPFPNRSSNSAVSHSRYPSFTSSGSCSSMSDPGLNMGGWNIEFGVYCSHCRSEVRGTQCAICKGFTFQCAICHVAVRGSSNFCLTCGHGGHTSHMMEWFRTQEVCPTGCGCHCLLESTF
ncbi:PREDICTED: WD repeat-containing protein 59 [Chrysochloris asiatica]|uniref:WD repeat-containing protein 59 n=1 Tax=Chrysochloris asiatica TaxID=185453 RepID=A0A9B0WJX6_CHRAS|nr:PREDICTED: WD repeat-containing protein 59 [Chrysochloris asiatica]